MGLSNPSISVTTEPGPPIPVEPVNAGSSSQPNIDEHATTILLNKDIGSTVVLPAATGSGMAFRCVAMIIPSGGTHMIKSYPGVFIGSINVHDIDGGTTIMNAVPNANTFTFDGAMLAGRVAGDYLDVQDIAPGIWWTRGQVSTEGAGGNPYSVK